MEMIVNINEELPAIITLIQVVAGLIGVYLVLISGILRSAQLGSPGSSATPASVVTSFFVGSALLALMQTLNVSSEAIFDANAVDTLSYSAGSAVPDELKPLQEFIFNVAQVLGIGGLFAGLLKFNRAGQAHAPNERADYIQSGFAFVIGGILLWNLTYVIAGAAYILPTPVEDFINTYILS